MLKTTQAQFEAMSLEEKLLWLFRETQGGAEFDNRLSGRISAVDQALATVAARVKALEQDK